MAYGKDDELAINTIRLLAVDATFKANSGHPGAPMGMAPVAHVMFNKFMSFNPKNPDWVNRDRFVLSCVILPFTKYFHISMGAVAGQLIDYTLLESVQYEITDPLLTYYYKQERPRMYASVQSPPPLRVRSVIGRSESLPSMYFPTRCSCSRKPQLTQFFDTDSR